MAEEKLAKRDLDPFSSLFATDDVSKAGLDQKESAFHVAQNLVREAQARLSLLEAGAKPETLALHERMIDRAQAAIESLHRRLEKSVIVAPISGKVIRRNVQVGEVVFAEHPVSIATVSDLHHLEINAEVDETDVGRLQLGTPVQVTSDAFPGKVFRGSVRTIADYVGARSANPNNMAKNVDMKVVQVRVNIPDDTPLRLGMTVNVRIEYGLRQGGHGA